MAGKSVLAGHDIWRGVQLTQAERKKIAEKLAEARGIKYKSALRSVQRYTTTAVEKRGGIKLDPLFNKLAKRAIKATPFDAALREIVGSAEVDDGLRFAQDAGADHVQLDSESLFIHFPPPAPSQNYITLVWDDRQYMTFEEAWETAWAHLEDWRERQTLESEWVDSFIFSRRPPGYYQTSEEVMRRSTVRKVRKRRLWRGTWRLEIYHGIPAT